VKRLAIRESQLTIRSAPVRTMLLLALGALAGFLVADADLRELSSLYQQDTAERLSGRDIWEVRGGAVSASACEDLAREASISASAAIISESSVSLAVQPSARFRVVHATAGLASLAWPRELPSGSVVAGARAAEEFGLSAGVSRLPVGGGAPIRVDVAAREPSRIPELDRALVVVEPVGNEPSATQPSATQSAGNESSATQSAGMQPAGIEPSGPRSGRTPNAAVCYVEAKPSQRAEAKAAVLYLAGDGEPINVTPFTDASRGRPPAIGPTDRLGAGIAMFGSLMCVVLLALQWMERSREFAVYRLSGFQRGDLAAMFVFETIVFGVAPLLWGMALACVAHVSSPLPGPFKLAALVDGVCAGLVVLSAVPLAVWWFTRRSPLAAIRAG
jgi:hypothetical protein